MKRRYKIAGAIFSLLGIAVLALAVTISRTNPCDPPPPVAEGAELMTAVVARCYGSPDVLEVVDIEKPLPGDDDVLVKIKSAAVNPLDWHYMRGSPYVMRLSSGLGTPADIRVGADFAGVVDAVGDNVTTFSPGDEVFGVRSGAFAEYVVLSADRRLVHKPADVTFEQAAAIPVAGVTALQALRDAGQLRAGQKVLINGASGGVGTFAVQIAKSLGAEVTGVCSTRNVEMVKGLGADYVIDYKSENYTESGKKYDLIIDNVGNHPVLKNTAVLTPNGRMVIVGAANGDWIGPLKRPLAAIFMSPFVEQELVTFLANETSEDLETLAAMLASGEVTSVIDRRFSLDGVPDAIRYSETGRARGKIIIELD